MIISILSSNIIGGTMGTISEKTIRTIYNILIHCKENEELSESTYRYYSYVGDEGHLGNNDSLFERLSRGKHLLIKTNLVEDMYICALLYVLGSAYDNCYLGFDNLVSSYEASTTEYLGCFGVGQNTDPIMPYMVYDYVPESDLKNSIHGPQKVYSIDDIICLIDKINPGIIFGG